MSTKVVVFVVVTATVVFVGLLQLAVDIGQVTKKTNIEVIAKKYPEQKSYEDGINDALTTNMLLDLELSMKGERKTWGERNHIICQRLKVVCHCHEGEMTHATH